MHQVVFFLISHNVKGLDQVPRGLHSQPHCPEAILLCFSLGGEQIHPYTISASMPIVRSDDDWLPAKCPNWLIRFGAGVDCVSSRLWCAAWLPAVIGGSMRELPVKQVFCNNRGDLHKPRYWRGNKKIKPHRNQNPRITLIHSMCSWNWDRSVDRPFQSYLSSHPMPFNSCDKS